MNILIEVSVVQIKITFRFSCYFLENKIISEDASEGLLFLLSLYVYFVRDLKIFSCFLLQRLLSSFQPALCFPSLFTKANLISIKATLSWKEKGFWVLLNFVLRV